MSRTTRSTAKRLTRLQPPSPVPIPSSPTPPETKLFPTPSLFESYLSLNHSTNQTGIWLKIAKKNSPIPSITYDQALDTALCYGWIDGQRKSHDAAHFIQRFTPRRKKSLWSQRNVNKVADLIASGRMTPAGQAEIDAAREDGRWERAYSSSSNAVVPEDFERAFLMEVGNGEEAGDEEEEDRAVCGTTCCWEDCLIHCWDYSLLH
ncbi:hypothetical protein FBULB1_7251 [Fusarium bulbicola]|nr:hypothetical protein FBULB1_7251 [Fusarium bulbicola]